MVRENKARWRRHRRKESIWEDPKLRRIMDEPVGSSSLAQSDLKAIIRAGFGAQPEGLSGEEYVRGVKRVWRGLIRTRD